MSQINIHNYEAHLLDFSEGNLTDELQMELELFLIQHPELDINLSELSLVSIAEETVLFSNKSNLKKSESDLISEEQFIAYIERQLPAHEKIGLEKSCAVNPSLANELALYQKTIAVADTTIVYQNKNKLKRKPKVIWFDFSLTQYAAAACVLFLIGLFILWPKADTVNNFNLATSSNNNQQRTIIKNESQTLVASNTQYSNTVNVKETNTLSQKSNYTVAKSKNINTPLTNPIVSNNQNTITKKDSATKPIELQNPTNVSQNEILLATNTAPTTKKQNNTVVQVITENDDEPTVSNNDKKKKGIWAAASRALKNLNNVGVKSVNGDNNAEKETSTYALTLGGVSITHKGGL